MYLQALLDTRQAETPRLAGTTPVHTMYGEWSSLAVPPPHNEEAEFSNLGENSVPIIQTEVRALQPMVPVDPEEQKRIAARLVAFKQSYVDLTANQSRRKLSSGKMFLIFS